MRYSHRRHVPSTVGLTAIEPLTRLWILRMLITLGGHHEFITRHGFCDDELARNIGLAKWIDPDGFDFDEKSILNELRKIHKQAENEITTSLPSTCLTKNLKQLSKLVGLSEVDCGLLEFTVLLHTEKLLEDAADTLGYLASVKMFRVLSTLLDISENEIRASLSPQSLLARSGLISIDRGRAYDLKGKLEFLSRNFADYMSSSELDPITLLRGTVSLSSQPLLNIDDYSHIKTELNIIRPYLKKSVKEKRQGVNIFLYGPPGTGKTQLVRVLAEEVTCTLFEVASDDEEGEPVDGKLRLRSYSAAQNIFKKEKAIILFDEVEDIFDDGHHMFRRRSTAQSGKGWMNRTLEENFIPTIWVSNSIYNLDPAFIRRFDIVIELPVPSKKKRQGILSELCKDFLEPKNIERIAQSEHLSPAVVNRAASVARSIDKELGKEKVSSAFELLINNTLEAQGHQQIKRNDPNLLPKVYDTSYLQTDTNITELAAGLIASKSARLCFYGPPGTGKTAYGRWLADKMDVPLNTKRVSDLISMWVGGSEKNLAQAFKEAESDGAILLIDEVDSFLQDRRDASQSWEITLVNEMLTQMESFSGVFIASTNLMKGLDQAALRRFDLKIKFDYMSAQQAWNLLHQYCVTLNIPEPKIKLKPSVGQLINLTPGDFAAIARRHRFQPIKTAEYLVNALKAECDIKEGTRRKIGFLSV